MRVGYSDTVLLFADQASVYANEVIYRPNSLKELQKGRRLYSSDPCISTATIDVCANQVALVPAMVTFLKSWDMLVLLLCLQYSLLVQSTSRREFMEYHHLDPNKEFSEYKCNVLMADKDLKPKISHLFIYISWYKVEHICVSGNWKDRYKDSYVWAQTPIKVLRCNWENAKQSYTERRSYNYMQFHCNADGYVDSIEDTKVLEPIFA
ncbi:epididymal secretory protein E3-beta [Sigmodon hispidus]